MVKKLYELKPISTAVAERPKIRWEHYLKEDLRIIKINNWTRWIQDRTKWKEVVEKAKPSNSEIVAPDEDEQDVWLKC